MTHDKTPDRPFHPDRHLVPGAAGLPGRAPDGTQRGSSKRGAHCRAAAVLSAVALVAGFAAQRGVASPLAIGTQKQLFIDDSVVERREGVSRVLNMPEKFDANPVLYPEREWEGNCMELISIVYDDRESLWKMWYSARMIYAKAPAHSVAGKAKGETPGPNPRVDKGSHREDGRVTCYATSKDGIHWDRPNLGLVEFNGSKNNNIIPVSREIGILMWMLVDDHDPNRDRRYKGGGRFNPGLYFSPDGIHPTPFDGRPTVHSTYDENLSFVGWDDRLQRYVGYFRTDRDHSQPDPKLTPPPGISDARTIVAYSESTDFIHWTGWGPALVPDEKDPVDLQFYGMPAMKYEGYYLGFPWLFRMNRMTIESGFAYSRDGERYSRLENRTPFLPLGAHGTWEDCGVYVDRPVVRDDRLWFYYGASNFGHSYVRFVERKEKARFAIGLATLPIDGFVSMDAGPGSGAVVTPPLIFSGRRLLVNFESSVKSNWAFGAAEASSLRVALLDADGKPLDGGLSDSVTDTGVRQTVVWRDPELLERLAGRPLRLKFQLRNGKLYSFQFRN